MAIREKQDNMKIAFLPDERNPTNAKAETMRELIHIKKNN